MPVYEFRCITCGPFDLQLDMRNAASVADCPSCASSAQRHYRVGVGRATSGALRDAGRTDRARVERARSGEPLITGPPSGRLLPKSSPHRH
jgi:putative FmdB family regulatory protein